MRKKILSLALVLCMVLSLLPGAAFAADSDFTIENGVLIKYNGPGGNVTIPSGVTEIGDLAFFNCKTLTGVTIPDSVTQIGYCAFRECSGLTSVVIPDSVTSIGEEAFDFCGSLTSVVIPESVISIGKWAFDYTPWLESLGEFAIVNGILLKYQGSGGSVTVPDGVTRINGAAFRNVNLTSVKLPSSVTSIGNYAFDSTPWLRNQGDFAILNGILVKYQGSGGSVTIPKGVTSIGGGAFASSVYITSVTIPEGVTSLDEEVFQGSCVTSVTIPGSVDSVGWKAFGSCPDLTDIYYGGTREQWSSLGFQVTVYMENEEAVGDVDVTDRVNVHFIAGGFHDVEAEAYYADAVLWAVEEEITSGTGENTFSPDAVCSHVEIVALLWGAEGKPAAAAQAPFTVASYFTDAVNWAYETGVIGNDFDPSAPCTRADTVSYLWKAAGAPGAGANSFPDVPAGAPYAQAVSWAVSRDITQGDDAGNFAPGLTCTRGQIVTFLYRAYA